MFSINVCKEENDLIEVSIVEDNGLDYSLHFRFTPEDVMNIPSTIMDSGDLSWPTSNGVCSIIWTPNVITFEIAKYGDGDGNGGSLRILVNNTTETMNSFRNALDEWVKLVK